MKHFSFATGDRALAVKFAQFDITTTTCMDLSTVKLGDVNSAR